MRDKKLLDEYRRTRSDEAFAQIVARYLNPVFSTCLREVEDRQMAEDVTQAVFLLLARKILTFGPNVALSGWLFNASRLVSRNALRAERRRRARETKAALMQTQSEPASASSEALEGELNEALAALNAGDRLAVLLRYFDELSIAEVGQELGVSADAAQMRLGRAIRRLRQNLVKQGIGDVSTAALGAFLLSEALKGAHAELGLRIVSSSTAAGAGVTTIVENAMKQMWIAQMKTAACVSVCAFAGVGTAWHYAVKSTPRVVRPMHPVLAEEDSQVHAIPNIPKLAWGLNGETTFAGALSAASHAFPQTADYVQIMGDTGLAFRLRWYHPLPDEPVVGVAPLGEFPEEMARASAALGITLHARDVPKADAIARRATMNDLVTSINAGLPVIAYIAPNKDCGLVYGYKGDGHTVLVRDYYANTANEQSFENLDTFFIFMRPGSGKPLDRRAAVVAGLRAAVTSWSNSDNLHDSNGAFTYGSHAFAAWQDDLTTSSGSRLTNHVNWWVFDCLTDARSAAVNYLRQSADLFDGPAKQHLVKAADLYDQESGITSRTYRAKDVFLGPWTGKKDADWTPAVRTEEAALLARCEPLEAQAIAEIRLALAADAPAVASP